MAPMIARSSTLSQEVAIHPVERPGMIEIALENGLLIRLDALVDKKALHRVLSGRATPKRAAPR